MSQAELVGEQGRQLWRDLVRRLGDRYANARVAEAAVAAHLRHADVGVPVRDRAVAGVGLEVDALHAKGRRERDRQRRRIERNDVSAVEDVVARIVFTRAPAIELSLETGVEHGRERDDRSYIEIPIGPSVEALADTRRERVVHGRVA